MGKCIKVKNPCKICLQTVTKKTGLQCQGGCRKWAHYTCLNYTPGRIEDIKAGIITVKCPCFGCNTTLPKEYLTNPPFTCTNPKCPANNPPRCESVDCPHHTFSVSTAHISVDSPHQELFESTARESMDCPHHEFSVSTAPIMHQCPSGIKLQMIPSSDSSTCPPAPCGPDAPCASSDSSVAITPPVMRPCPVLESRPVKKTKSCSCASKDGEDSKMRLFKTSSEVHVASTNSVYITMQEMCNTVGQLSSQLKQLMCKMMDTVPNT